MRPRHMCALLPFILLAGCSAPLIGLSTVSPAVPERNPTRTPPPTATLVPPRGPEPASYETRTDTQGAVTFEVTPVNLSGATGTLEFAVVMNTHSVDLDWDLAERAVLRTDSGREVKGLSWPVGRGHHYSGTLAFPSQAPDGTGLLNGAQVLTLILGETDVPERVFTWEVQP